MQEKIRKMISLYQQGRMTGKEEKKKMAETLLDEIIESCNDHSTLSYSNGLCCIGATIEYLIRNGFAKGDSDDILEEIDRAVITAINNRSLKETSITNGLLGLACYLYERLYYRPQSEEYIVLILKEHIIYLIDWMEETLMNGAIKKNYYEFYFVLVVLHQLDIFNAKIEKMLERCDKEIERKYSYNLN